MSEPRLLLDTCALLWLVAGDKSLSPATLDAIERASIVYVCPISAWEISLKCSRKALKLPSPPLQWFTQSIKHHNLIVSALDLDILVGANALPWHHNDPADRFIIATALRERAAIVTTDTRFAAYNVKTMH